MSVPGAKLPPSKFTSASEERIFRESHRSPAYVDWNPVQSVELSNLKPSTQRVSLRLPFSLLERIKVEANKRDVPYQSLIKAGHPEDVDRRGR